MICPYQLDCKNKPKNRKKESALCEILWNHCKVYKLKEYKSSFEETRENKYGKFEYD